MASRRGSYRQRLGWRREADARGFLERAGLVTIASNYRCRGGEIDLVMRDRDTIVSVEVRFRSASAFGGAIVSIDERKQRRWVLATRVFLTERPDLAAYCVRFDAVGIQKNASGQTELEWLRDVLRLSDD